MAMTLQPPSRNIDYCDYCVSFLQDEVPGIIILCFLVQIPKIFLLFCDLCVYGVTCHAFKKKIIL